MLERNKMKSEADALFKQLEELRELLGTRRPRNCNVPLLPL
jgi:hypothetical protein